MGCLRQRTPGSWQLLFYVDGDQKSKTIKGTKREAERVLREIERSVDQGEYQAKPKEVVTVAMVLRDWLEDSRGRVAVTTHNRYEIAVRKWLLPSYGGFDVNALGPREIDATNKGWVSSGVSPTSVKMHHEVLSMALTYAMRRELVMRNVAALVKPPPCSRATRGTLSQEEVEALMSECGGHQYGPQALLALLTGLRLGEICALRWDKVKPSEGTLEVRQSASTLKGGVIIKSPKTRSSVRVVALPRQAVELLESLPREGDYVFGGEKPLSPAAVSCGVSRMLRSLGFPITMHGLRHTHASMLNRLSVNPKVIQERLGHSSIRESMDTYTHLLPHQQREAVSVLSDNLPEQ